MMQQFSSIFSVVMLVILIGFIASCGGDDELIGADYLPIAVGNFWNFIDPESSRGSGSISIIGTTKLRDGKTVFIGKTDDEEEGYLSRAATDLILFHQTINDLQGELIYNPPITVGATWQDSRGEARVVAQETVNTPAGIFRNCFRIDMSVVDDNNYYSIWLAKDVGPVKLAVIDISDGDIERTFVLAGFSAR